MDTNEVLLMFGELKQEGFQLLAHSEAESHNHPADLGVTTKALISRDAKEIARKAPNSSAAEIVETVFLNLPKDLQKGALLPKQNLLTRTLNREKAKSLPRINVNDITYSIALDQFEGNLFMDVIIKFAYSL